MQNQYLTYTFILKDNSEIEIEREAYFGFIYAEGFGLKGSLKIKENEIFYLRWKEKETFTTCKEFLSFLIMDMEDCEESEVSESEYYPLLNDKIHKISDIKELKAYFRYYDYDEPELNFEMKETIKFTKFKGDF